MKKYLYIFLVSILPSLAGAQTLFQGKVADAGSKAPLPGASVSLKHGSAKAIADQNGNFRILVNSPTDTLQFFYIGYKPVQQALAAGGELHTFHMELASSALDEVTVSTGYQTLPKERATGSFDQIDNPLFSRVVSTDVLSRLDGVARRTV